MREIRCFITAAWWDDHLQTPLQQIQIVKGWVNERGETNEEVLTVAGTQGFPRRLSLDKDLRAIGASELPRGAEVAVDRDTCEPLFPEIGSESLCTVWEDTNFDPAQSAFYYVRVLERPVCRYSTLYCMENFGLNPLKPVECQINLAKLEQTQPARAQNALSCCNNERSNAIVQPVIQERAWTSPIWYEP